MDILDKIKSYKLDEIAAAKAARPLSGIEAAARAEGTRARRVAPGTGRDTAGGPASDD